MSNCQAKLQMQKHLFFVYQNVHQILHRMVSSLTLWCNGSHPFMICSPFSDSQHLFPLLIKSIGFCNITAELFRKASARGPQRIVLWPQWGLRAPAEKPCSGAISWQLMAKIVSGFLSCLKVIQMKWPLVMKYIYIYNLYLAADQLLFLRM